MTSSNPVTVWSRITHRATGAGVSVENRDHDVTGKQVTWDAIAIFRMQDGK
jgi:hypothetical protein